MPEPCNFISEDLPDRRARTATPRSANTDSAYASMLATASLTKSYKDVSLAGWRPVRPEGSLPIDLLRRAKDQLRGR